MPVELINLPWTTLLTLAAGYAGYVMANLGVRSHHQAIDVTFGTLLYGFAAAFLYAWLRRNDYVDIGLASLFAFLFAPLVGVIWSRFCRHLVEGFLYRTGASPNNDLQNAWQELFRTPGMISLQLMVVLKNGKVYFCDDLQHFRKYPHGPCVLGGAGDVLMYVTHSKKPGGSFEETPGLLDDQGAPEITYFPQSEIERVDVRRAFEKDLTYPAASQE